MVDAANTPWAADAALGRMLTREEALASGQATEAFTVADAAWLEDPRLPIALWGEGARCDTCGKVHPEETLELAFKWPTPIAQMSDAERDFKVFESSDICVIRAKRLFFRADRFFLRATLPLPVHGRSRPYSLGVWVQLSEKDLKRIDERWNDPEQAKMPPFEVSLANDVPTLPSTLGLRAQLRLVSPETRPEVYLHPDRHALTQEQAQGISTHRAAEYSAIAML